VRQTFAALLPGWPFDIAVGKSPAEVQPDASAPPFDALRVRAAKLRDAAPPFVEADEAFFWANIDAVFEGRLPPPDFPAMQGLGATCYIDASSFLQLDLRQLLLLYDTLILSPPLDVSFWASQHLTREDVFALIDAGRLRFLLRLPEERTDPNLLAAAFERNSKAVIGRLTGAAIFAADLVSTTNEYTLAHATHRKDVAQLDNHLARVNAGAILQRLAGVTVQQGCPSRKAPSRGPSCLGASFLRNGIRRVVGPVAA